MQDIRSFFAQFSLRTRRILFLSTLSIIFAGILAFALRIDEPEKTSPQPQQEMTKQAPLNKNAKKNFMPKSKSFSLSYPAALTLVENSYPMGAKNYTLQDTANQKYHILIIPTAVAAMLGQNFEDIYALPPQSELNLKNPLSRSSGRFIKTGNRTINEQKAVAFTVTDNPPKPGKRPEIGIFMEIEDDVVAFTTTEQNHDMFEEILSTLSFPRQ